MNNSDNNQQTPQECSVNSKPLPQSQLTLTFQRAALLNSLECSESPNRWEIREAVLSISSGSQK